MHTVFSVPKFQTLPTDSATTDRQKKKDRQTPTPNTNSPPEAQKVPRNSKQDQHRQNTDRTQTRPNPTRLSLRGCPFSLIGQTGKAKAGPQTNKQANGCRPAEQLRKAQQKPKESHTEDKAGQQADRLRQTKKAYIIWLKVLCLAK